MSEAKQGEAEAIGICKMMIEARDMRAGVKDELSDLRARIVAARKSEEQHVAGLCASGLDSGAASRLKRIAELRDELAKLTGPHMASVKAKREHLAAVEGRIDERLRYYRQLTLL